MSLWDQYAPLYEFFSFFSFWALLLGFWLLLKLYYRRRREWRLGSGWRLEPNESRLVKTLDEISTLLFGAWIGVEVSGRFHTSSGTFLILALVITLLTPRENWVRPPALPGGGSNAGEGNES